MVGCYLSSFIPRLQLLLAYEFGNCHTRLMNGVNNCIDNIRDSCYRNDAITFLYY